MVVALGPGRFYGSSLPRPRFYSDVKLSDDGNRVDPPVGVLDPLLSWAREAHWSMGGLSFERHRLQGRIEGSVKLLRVQEERKEKEKKKRMREESILVGSRKLRKKTAQVVISDDEEVALPEVEEEAETESDSDAEEGESDISPTPIPPPAPVVRSSRSGTARRKLLRRALLDDSDGEGIVRESVPATPISPTSSQAAPATSAGERVSGGSPRPQKRKRARKLGEEFDRLAAVDSPANAPPVSTASSGKKSAKKTLTKDNGKSVESSTLVTAAARKLDEEFDEMAVADSPSTVVPSSIGKRLVKNKGKTADAASLKRISPRVSPTRSLRRTRAL